jgi:thiamine pyrophosphokinase
VKAVIVASGEPVEADLHALDGADLVLAADGGANWLAAAGISPDWLVGDLDSIGADELAGVESSGARIERHPVAKDASDLTLAVKRARALGADEIVILGALHGDRLDHELANVLLLADPALRGHDVRIQRGGTMVRALAGPGGLELAGRAGARVTMLPVTEAAAGITTRGLRYPLMGETVVLGSSRGLSNEILEPGASVQLEAGVLLVVEEPIGESQES